MFRILLSAVLSLFLLGLPAQAQTTEAPEPDRSATGGAQTLEDIMARQRGEAIDDTFRRDALGDPNSAAAIAAQLGTLGGVSDAEGWRSLRFNSADITVSSGGEVATVLVQDGGMKWLQFREGPLRDYGGNGLLLVIVLLILFYLIRDRIPIDGGRTGRTVTRFKAIERFAHWLLAGSFILLGVTGLLSLFGRVALVPLFGHGANSTILIFSKWVHNNVSWAFMLGLIMVFVMWVIHNLPHRSDLTWIAQGGGIFSKKHPPARKFNAGQKVIFWSVIVLGGSISLSGLSLLFPFELPMFAKTFVALNSIGAPGWVGLDPLPTVLTPHQEMQFAQAWHAIVSFLLMAIIIAHIYIGTVGMEGAYDAMGSGEVDEAWAHQHHSIWLDDLKAKEATDKAATPAE